MGMKDFPEFMKSGANRVDTSQQNTADVDGYYYTANDGSQMAFWTCYGDRVSDMHRHDYDEYHGLPVWSVHRHYRRGRDRTEPGG